MLPSRAADIVAVMRGDRPAAEVFSAGFLAAIPPDKLAAIVTSMVAQFGAVTGADEVTPSSGNAARFVIRFERGKGMAQFSIDASEPGKVTSLLITQAAPLDDAPQRILDDFAALPGRSGFALVKLGPAGPSPILTGKPAEHFAVASAFKLWVLDALAGEIAAGRLRWDQVVRLGQRSVPSGIMQDWPPGAAVTLETLATLMISRSDNTATDTLIRLVGREAVARRVIASRHSAPAKLLPILTTAEVFALKSGPEADRQAFLSASEAGQARFLATYRRDAQLPRIDPAAVASDNPAFIDTIEWFASANDIAGVFDSLRKRKDPKVLAILAVNPGLPAGALEPFAYSGYKGGSESGVINLSWLLRNARGDWFVASASWNDSEKPVDEARFLFLAQRLVALAK